MENEVIKQALKNCKDICNINVSQAACFREKECKYMIDCGLIVADEVIPIVIAIPEDWSRILVDIYIEQYLAFPFIPHVDVKGKICLFDLEGILIDQNLGGILLQSIARAKEIIIDGLNGKNRLDFIEEFDLYWCQLPGARTAKFNIPDNQKTQVVKFAEKCEKQRKSENFSKFSQRKENSHIYISQKSQDLKLYGIEESAIKNAIYVNIVMGDLLLPPDGRQKITEDYLQSILAHADIEELRKIISRTGDDKLFLFRIQQPNKLIVYLGFFLRKCVILIEGETCKINKISSIKPVVIDRIDKKYLMSRSSDSNNVLGYKKILLVGCGSLGGYIANELVKAGVESIMLVDKDHLYEANIFRHLLGMEYVGMYKSVALQKYLEKNIPNLKLATLEDGIENAIQEGNIEFQHYDMIISAIGNHNANRWINEYMFRNKIRTPVIFAWNEVLGIGNHIAYIKYGGKGCYECFFNRDEDTLELYDCTSYSQPGQNNVRKLRGCGSAFIPYGSTISLKTACMCLDTVKKVFENRYIDNVIISSKSDEYYFNKAGLKLSDKYLNQTSDTKEYSGSQFGKKMCIICGE